MGDGMFGWNDARRETERGEAGASPRREELDDLRTRAGEEERLRLATLGLRRTVLAWKLGDEGVRRGSMALFGECKPGDGGRAVFVAACSERRLSGCCRRFASLFVWRLARGVPGALGGPWDSDG